MSTRGPGTDADRQAAQGTVSFDCLLEPFRSGFRYEAETTMVAARASSDAPEVEIGATFSDLPGISPAQIDDGAMTIVAKGTAAGEKFRLEGVSQVTSAPKAAIPMPRVTGQVATSANAMDVEVTEFRLAFEEMMGLTITATCLPATGGGLGTMAVASGSLDEEMDGVDDQQGNGSDAAPAGPDDDGTGSQYVLAVLWVLGVVGAGLVVWLARRRMRRS